MALVHAAAPEDGLAKVGEALSQLLNSGTSLGDDFGANVTEPHALAPQPMYTFTREDLAADDLLASARRVGWRYSVVQGEEPVAVVTLRDTDDGVAADGMTIGRLSQAFLDGVAAAEALPEVQAGDYELRYLQSHEMYFAGVWLAGEAGDIILPMEGHAHADVSAHTPLPPDRMLDVLRRQLAFHNPIPAGE